MKDGRSQLLAKLWLPLFALILASCAQGRADEAASSSRKAFATEEQGLGSIVKLPPPTDRGRVYVEHTLAQRRSREFTDAELSDAEHAQLLWAAQGISHRTRGLRTAPSAGALS